jgi:hypothetical protein
MDPGRVQTIIGITGLQNTQTPMVGASKTSSSTLATTTGSSSSAKPSPTTAQNSTAPAPQPTTQKKGFKVGMGVLFALIGLALVALAWLYGRKWYLNRRRRQRTVVTGQPMTTYTREPADDPYVDLNAGPRTIQDPPPGPSRSGHNLLAPSNNPYEQNAPSNLGYYNFNGSAVSGDERTTSPQPSKISGSSALPELPHWSSSGTSPRM